MFVSPVELLTTANGWDVVEMSIPAGLRHGGETVMALQGDFDAPVSFVAPVAAFVREAPTGSGAAVVAQLDPMPFADIDVTRALPTGMPTIYMLLPAATAHEQRVVAGELLADRRRPTIAVVFPDRLTRTPAQSWRLLASVDPALSTFVEAVFEDPNPLLIVDHAGVPIGEHPFQVETSAGTTNIRLRPLHGGDLFQASGGAFSRADIDAGGVIIRSRSGTDVALVADNGAAGRGELTIPAGTQHLAMTDFASWFSNAYGTPYTNDNDVVFLANGRLYMEDLIDVLETVVASATSLGFHAAGVTFGPEDVVDFRGTAAFDELLEAVDQIAGAGGSSRFLVTRLIRVGSVDEAMIVIIWLLLAAGTLTLAIALGGDEAIDASGVGHLVLALVLIGVIGWIVLPMDDFEVLEPGNAAVGKLTRTGSTSTWDVYPQTHEDNPDSTGLASDLNKFLGDFNHFRQRIAVALRDSGLVSYVGGLDIEATARDDARHLRPFPVFGVQARTAGPVAGAIAQTFADRWNEPGDRGALAFPTPSVGSTGSPGSMVAQLGHTYYRPTATAGLGFAATGDATIMATYLEALAQAREFLFIADEFLIPPPELRPALLDAVSRVDVAVVAGPSLNHVPLTSGFREEFVGELRAAGGNVKIGTLRNPCTVAATSASVQFGRVTLASELTDTLDEDVPFRLTPYGRVPGPPFWLDVDGELLWVFDKDRVDPAGWVEVRARRGDHAPHQGHAEPKGSKPAKHAVGTPATVVRFGDGDFRGGVLIVDDVFAGVGSATLSRRGMFSDGHATIFTMDQSMRFSSSNPVAALRRELWADLLGIPLSIGDVLLRDPLASVHLFDRPFFDGNRFAGMAAHPSVVDDIIPHLGGDVTSGVLTVATTVIDLISAISAAASRQAVFDAILDPTSSLEEDF